MRRNLLFADEVAQWVIFVLFPPSVAHSPFLVGTPVRRLKKKNDGGLISGQLLCTSRSRANGLIGKSPAKESRLIGSPMRIVGR